MGRRFCPRRWIRGAGEGGEEEGLSDTVTLERKPWGETIITLHTQEENDTKWFRWLRERASFFDFWGLF